MNEEKPKNKKKMIILGILILIVISCLFYLKQEKSPKSAADLIGKYASKEEAYTEYLQEGLKYKSEGDGGNKESYYRALESYQKAADVAEGKVWIPYYNLGNIYQIVGDYDNSDKSYDKALEIAPDNTTYLAKIQLYQYDLKKPADEVNALYLEALSKTVDNVDIMTKYAAYLRDNGSNEESLKYWKIISSKYPDDQRYKDEIAALEAKIAQKK